MGYSLHLTSRLLALIAFLAFTVAGMAFAQSALAQTYEAELTGDEEVPPVETETSGFIQAEFGEDQNTVDYDLDVFAGEDITQAHFHCAPEGENGPVIAFLFGPESEGVDVDGALSSGTLINDDILEAGMDCPTPVTDIETLETAMAEGEIYANVHSEEFPSGVVRGQMIEVDAGDDDDDTATSTDDEGEDTATSTDDEEDTATVTAQVILIKHLCPEDIDSVDELLDIGRIAERFEHCPVITLPGDEQTGFANGEDVGDFDFLVTDENGDEQTIEDATYSQAAYCEDDFPVDFDGDGTIEEDVCIDISHYIYDDLTDGVVTVEEIEPPQGTSFGIGYLEFALPTEEDFAEDEDAGLVPFDEPEVTFDTADGTDGVVAVHVFNFRDADEGDDGIDDDDGVDGDDGSDGDDPGTDDREDLDRRIQRLEERIDRLIERLEQQITLMQELLETRQ